MNKIYLIESGVMLDAVKDYINKVANCRSEYSEFAKQFGADSYFQNGKKLYALQLSSPPEGWTKPRKKDNETRPKKGHDDCEKIKALPEMPDQCEIIRSITGVPLGISYKGDGCSGSTCIGSPLNECGFLYSQKHELYALWLPDVDFYLDRYKDFEITNGADEWEMNIEGVVMISESKWNLLVAECKVKDEEGWLKCGKE